LAEGRTRGILEGEEGRDVDFLLYHSWAAWGLGIFVLLAGIAFLRWFRRKPKRARVPVELLEEMTRFAEEMRYLEENLDAVAQEFQVPGRRVWRRTSLRMVRLLRSVNDLLEHLNLMFEEEDVLRIVRRHRKPEEGEMPEEHVRFEGMRQITDDEIHDIDWDEFDKRIMG